MKEPTKHTESQQSLINEFRAYLQIVITAEQSGQRARLSQLPGAKTANYCMSLAQSEENILARELTAPFRAVVKQIKEAIIDFSRPLYHKTVKDSKKRAEYENALWQLDFALALMLRDISTLAYFRAKRTKCSDLLIDVASHMIKGPEAADLIRRYQKDFPEDGCYDNGMLVDGGFPETFAWDTYCRVEELDRMADSFPEHVKMAARRMHGWPMLAHRHTNNRKRFKELAERLELGIEYPLDATDGARFRPDTPLVRYLDPLVCKLVYVRNLTANETYETVEDETESLRFWWGDCQEERPTDEEISVGRALIKLPPLTKNTANAWAEKAVVPAIMVGDARDWKNCEEPVLQRIAKQKGVKSRATFKSRLLSAVSSTLRRLARPA
jgi:hypothetical protein